MVSAGEADVDPIDIGQDVRTVSQTAAGACRPYAWWKLRVPRPLPILQIAVASGLCVGWRGVSDCSYSVSKGYAFDVVTLQTIRPVVASGRRRVSSGGRAAPASRRSRGRRGAPPCRSTSCGGLTVFDVDCDDVEVGEACASGRCPRAPTARPTTASTRRARRTDRTRPCRSRDRPAGRPTWSRNSAMRCAKPPRTSSSSDTTR